MGWAATDRRSCNQAIRLRAMAGKAVVLAPRLCRCPAQRPSLGLNGRSSAPARGRQLISPLLPRCGVDAFIRLGLLKEDQRQDEEALRTAVISTPKEAASAHSGHPDARSPMC
jgi:hypothetical protein